MSSRTLLNRSQGALLTVKGTLLLITVVFFSIVSITGCGGGNSVMQLPDDFIRDFLAKHETMIDQSLVYYYVKEEQSEVAEKINMAVRINKAKGSLETLEKATFDFSALHIELLDKKEEYVNDEPVIFVKVAVKGKFTMELPEASKKIDADEIIILQMARHEWKVNEAHNPWS